MRVGACESSSTDMRGWAVEPGASEDIVIKPCFYIVNKERARNEGGRDERKGGGGGGKIGLV